MSDVIETLEETQPTLTTEEIENIAAEIAWGQEVSNPPAEILPLEE